MKLSNKQALIMFEIVKGSLNIADRTDMNIFSYSYQQRLELVNQIINQQSDELIELQNINNKIKGE